MTSKKKNTVFPRWLILMGLLSAIGPMATDMYLPAFPDIAAHLGVSLGDVERTLAGYLFGLAGAQLFYGPFADRYGRKKSLILGVSIFTVASIGCAMSDSIGQLTAWRIAQAFGGAAGMVIPRAVIRDNFETHEAAKALSLLMLIVGATPILAPILGGQLLVFTSWRSIFAFMSVAGAILLLLVLTRMRESLAPDRIIALNVGNIVRNYSELLKDKRYMCYCLTGGCAAAGMFAYISGSPRVFMNVYGVDSKHFGYFFGANAATYILSAQLSARFLNRYTSDQLLKTVLRISAIAGVAGAILALVGLFSLPLLMLFLMTFLGCNGFINPNSAAMALSQQGRRLGVASALMGTVHMLCGAAAGLAISLWQAQSALPLVGMMAVFSCLAWLFGRMAQRAA